VRLIGVLFTCYALGQNQETGEIFLWVSIRLSKISSPNFFAALIRNSGRVLQFLSAIFLAE